MEENLYLAVGKDIKKAEKRILVIDEFDKLAEKKLQSRSCFKNRCSKVFAKTIRWFNILF